MTNFLGFLPKYHAGNLIDASSDFPCLGGTNIISLLIAAGPVDNEVQAVRLREFGVDGIITPRPEDHLSILQ
jgi:hypothetical protein